MATNGVATNGVTTNGVTTNGEATNGDIQNGVVLHPKVVYHPKYKETQLVKFKNFVEKRYKIKLNEGWELYEWSNKNYPEFWECVWKFFDFSCSKPYTQVFDKKNDFLNAEWFKGVRFNYAENLLRHRDSRTAIIATDDEDNIQRVTYNELYDEVKLYVKAMKNAGIQKGDVVACYMPNRLEAVFVLLAAAAVGAKWSGGMPMLGAKGILSRFQQFDPKILFTTGNFFYGDIEIRMDLKVPAIVSGLPSLEKVVMIPSRTKGEVEDLSEIPKCVFLSEFLEEARNALRDDSSDIEFEQVPFDHPFSIFFTSGTTGAPKGLIHSAGVFIGAVKDFGLHQDITRDDVLFTMSPIGWIAWSLYVNSLYLGVTLILYDGNAFAKSPTRFWDLVDKFGITSSFMWSTTLHNIARKGDTPTSKHSLKTLKQLFPIGSPVGPHCFDFLTKKVKPNLFCTPVYGTTELFCCMAGMDSNLPVYRGEIQEMSLGMNLRILDKSDRSVIGKRGDVVISNPYPTMPISVLNDKNKEVLKRLYLSQHPGYWNLGDDGWRNPVTKGLIVYGRNDEQMNHRITRFNCNEIYFALEGFPHLMDSVCVSQFDNTNIKERVVLFVKMKPGHRLTAEVQDKMKETIENNLSVYHVPSLIVEAPDIPYNLTGKKLNGLVRNLINKRPILNTEVVANPTSVEFYETVDLGVF